MKNKLTALERLRKAWKTTPTGAITLVYEKHTQQNVADILKNGRKKDKIIEDIIDDLKEAGNKVTKEIVKINNKLQKI